MLLSPYETLKFNTNAAWKDQFSSIVIVVVVCNITSALLDGVIKHVWSYSPLAMEALAILETLRLTLARGSQSPNCSMDAEVFFLV